MFLGKQFCSLHSFLLKLLDFFVSKYTDFCYCFNWLQNIPPQGCPVIYRTIRLLTLHWLQFFIAGSAAVTILAHGSLCVRA